MTQMTRVLDCFGGLTFKNRGHLGSRFLIGDAKLNLQDGFLTIVIHGVMGPPLINGRK